MSRRFSLFFTILLEGKKDAKREIPFEYKGYKISLPSGREPSQLMSLCSSPSSLEEPLVVGKERAVN